MKTCNQCGHTWRERVDKPAKCPNCGSRKWNELEES